jgi:amino acid adenylation domain-containing protein
MTDHSTPLRTLALSSGQRAAQVFGQAGSATDNQISLICNSPLSPEQVRQALQRVFDSQWGLRCDFASVAGYRELRVCPNALAEWQWRSQDLRGLADPVVQFVRRLQVPMPGQGLRASLYRVGEQTFGLRLNLSRLHGDTTSLEQLVSLLGEALHKPLADNVLYARWLEWQSSAANAEDAEEGRAYWQARLQSPFVEARLAVRGEADSVGASDCQTLCLSPAQSRAWQALCEARGWLPEDALQTAWWALLARLGDGACVGGWLYDPRADYPEFATTLGAFAHVLPVSLERIDQPFSTLVSTFGTQCEGHRDWQDYWPLPGVQPSPMACGFAFVASSTTLPVGWQITARPSVLPSAELCLVVRQDVLNGTELSLEHRPALYPAVEAAGLLEQYRHLLLGLLAQPDARPADIDLSSEPLADATVASIEDMLPAIGPSQSIANWARMRPDAEALVGSDEYGRPVVLTYAELDAQVEHLAQVLRQRGAGPSTFVGLNLPRSPQLVIAVLAVLRSGAAYVPLDPGWPAQRRDAIQAQARVLLVIDELTTLLETPCATRAALPLPAPDDAAYVLFTSGSSGVPKGVVIEHRQLNTYLGASAQALGLKACRSFGLTSSVAADLGNTTLFGAFEQGARLVVASEAETLDGAAFQAFVRRHDVDCLKMTPSHVRALIGEGPANLPATLILGGEAVPAATLRRLFEARPDLRLFNHYGPTETTVGVLIQALSSSSANTAATLEQVLAGSRVRVLDAQGRPVARGARGQLYIGGAQLARGYLRAEANAAFDEDPWLAGERLYASGDLACLRHDGRLQLLGRQDLQIKVRGYRIEPAEIEAALLEQVAVTQAVVVAVAGADGDAVLHGHMVVQPAPDDSAQYLESLREALARRLPSAFVPGRWHLHRELPRLANGKPDRQALRAVSDRPDQAVSALARRQPASALEHLLLQRMAALLELPSLGVADDFFHAGGHSLLVIQLMGGLRDTLGIEPPPGVVFDFPSALELSAALLPYESVPGQLERNAERALNLSLVESA